MSASKYIIISRLWYLLWTAVSKISGNNDTKKQMALIWMMINFYTIDLEMAEVFRPSLERAQ